MGKNKGGELSGGTYLLSWPPSTNAIWRSYNGRNILSKEARAWREAAYIELVEQAATPVHGPVEVWIELCSPTRRKFDLDNRVKAVLDLISRAGIIDDDNNTVLQKLTVSCGKGFVGARLTIKEFTDG